MNASEGGLETSEENKWRDLSDTILFALQSLLRDERSQRVPALIKLTAVAKNSALAHSCTLTFLTF